MAADAGKFERYYDAVGQTPPRPTLLAALAGFDAEGLAAGTAADLGAGSGVDAIELIARGWRVIAIDKEGSALARLRERAGEEAAARLRLECHRFEDCDWGTVDLVNASFALPLVEPRRFPALWDKIGRSLKPGGRFAGQLYGPRDGWASHSGITIHARGAVDALTSGFTVEMLDEIERDGVTAIGKPKHWHYYNLVLRRI